MKKETSKQTKNESVKIGHTNADYFPVILDYDFDKKRPRGLSTLVDFFAYGSIATIIDEIELTPYVFIKKQDTFFAKGMILADFSKLETNWDRFAEMIKNLNTNEVYIEKSQKFPMDNKLKNLKNIRIIYLEA